MHTPLLPLPLPLRPCGDERATARLEMVEWQSARTSSSPDMRSGAFSAAWIAVAQPIDEPPAARTPELCLSRQKGRAMLEEKILRNARATSSTTTVNRRQAR